MGRDGNTGIANTGVVAMLKGGKPGGTVALRAEIDGLPGREEPGLSFASPVVAAYGGSNVGVMHACGHDAHMAILLGVAKTLSGMRDKVEGNILFIFQPAEEGAPAGEEGGAELMLKEGLFKQYKPDAVFGLHVGLNMPYGTIALRRGALMAAVDTLTINVKGRQTHGARPWGGVDPIVTSAQIINGLQTIVSRQVNITKAPAIVTIGKITGGVRHNIIPDEVELWGTIRTFDPEMRERIHEKIKLISENIAISAGAVATVEIETGYPVTVNDGDLYDQMLPTLAKVSGERAVFTPSLVTGAEDFSFFANEVPGMYFYLGSVHEGQDPMLAPSNHSPMFDVDESVLGIGARALSHLAIDYLSN
jgi:amidohydrolase